MKQKNTRPKVPNPMVYSAATLICQAAAEGHLGQDYQVPQTKTQTRNTTRCYSTVWLLSSLGGAALLAEWRHPKQQISLLQLWKRRLEDGSGFSPTPIAFTCAAERGITVGLALCCNGLADASNASIPYWKIGLSPICSASSTAPS